jgi:hypothetical protein
MRAVEKAKQNAILGSMEKGCKTRRRETPEIRIALANAPQGAGDGHPYT